VSVKLYNCIVIEDEKTGTVQKIVVKEGKSFLYTTTKQELSDAELKEIMRALKE